MAISIAGTVTTSRASSIVVKPATAQVAAGAMQQFTAKTSGVNQKSLEWMVEGQVGGGPIYGSITQQGLYTAPAIDPGTAVSVSATSTLDTKSVGNASVTVVNPPTPPLTGATYAGELASWEAVLMPRVQDRSGLAWDARARAWRRTKLASTFALCDQA